jgi:WD40 repeat protein
MPFDGFISYSHAADGRLAPAVQRGLHRLAKPWHRRRALWIFRDQTGLAVTPALWTSIQAALDGSKYFVLLASEEAARSQWVNREIEHWVATKSPDRILPVVTDGEWRWDPATGDFTAGSTAVPAALRGVFAEEPLYLDLRWARKDVHLSLQHPRFRDAIAQLAAPMHGVSKDELEGEDVRYHRRARRLSAVAVAALVALTLIASLAGVVATRNAGRATAAAADAREQQRVATEQRGTAERATEESQRQQENAQRQQENAQVQEARARDAKAETQRQAQLAREQQALAEDAAREAKREQAAAQRYQASADQQKAEAERQKASADQQKAEAEQQKATADREKANAEREKATAEREKVNAERQQAAAEEASREAARQRTNAEQQVANAQRQQELANQATARAKEQEKLAEQYSAQAQKADEERQKQEKLAREAAEDARRQREEMALQQRIVINRRLMSRARAMVTDDPRKALMLGVAAQRLHTDAETGDQLSHLAMATNYAGAISDAVDATALAGQAVATAGAGGTVTLWNTADPAKPVRLAPVPTEGSADKTLAAGPDGKSLAVFDAGPVAVLWDVTDPARPVRRATLSDDAGITAVAFSPDGHTVAASNGAKNTVLWDVTGAAPAAVATLPAAYPLKFSPDGRTGVTSGASVIVWDLTDAAHPVPGAKLEQTGEKPVADAAIEFNPELPLVAVEVDNDYIRFWDLSNPARPQRGWSQVAAYGDTTFSTMAFSADGRTMALGDSDGETALWSVTGGDGTYPGLLTFLATLTARGAPVRSITFSPDGRTVTTAGVRRTTTLWYPKGRFVPAAHATLPGPYPGNIVGLAFRPDSRSLIAAGYGGKALPWDLTDPAAPVRHDLLTLSGGRVESIALSRDGSTLIVDGQDKTVKVLDTSRPAEPTYLSTIPEQGAIVTTIRLSPDGQTLAIGRRDGQLSLWDLTNRHQPALLAKRILRKPLPAVAFSPDGQTLAVSESYNVSLWNLADLSDPVQLTSIPLTDYIGYTAESLAFSPDGRTLAAGTDNAGEVLLWDVADPTQAGLIATLTGHSLGVRFVAFTPDGRTLVTASIDNAVMMWDVAEPASPLRFAVIKNHELETFYSVLSPDGRAVAVGGDIDADVENVTLWDTTVPKELAADPVRQACEVSGRGLNPDEWARYIPELDYQSTC